MRHRLPLALAFLAVAALGCSESDGDEAGLRDTAPASTLTVSLAADADGTGKQSWTLTCDPAGGDHPDPAAACRSLAAAARPFEPVPADAICTEIYGGSAVGRVTGTWKGEAVDATYTRQNGCHISRYDAMGAVFPSPPPGQPTP